MSLYKHGERTENSVPRRSLRSDFTKRALANASRAKRRANKKQELTMLSKELFSMKTLKFMRTIPGAALAVTVVATGSVGVYALTNWFGGNVTVTQNDPSVFSVDLSSCKGNLPPGVDSADRRNVQFRILGNPHISAADLQNDLLTQCELDSVVGFYQNQPATADSSYFSGAVKSIGANGTATLQYSWGGQLKQKTFALDSNPAIYSQGQAVRLDSLHAGDPVVFAAQLPANYDESTDPLGAVDKVQGIFITQYDTAQAPSASKQKNFYQGNNIMPLDMHNSLQK